MRYTLLIICFGVYALAGCRSSKKIQISPHRIDSLPALHPETHGTLHKNAVELLSRLREDSSYLTFSSKLNIQYEDEYGKQPDFHAFIRLKKDSVIWISFMATFLNIEGYRLLITPDSIKILNKMEKTFATHPYNYIETFTKFPISFSALQNLITGKPLYAEGEIFATRKSHGFIQVGVRDSAVNNIISINTHRDLLAKQELNFFSPGRDLQVQLYYDEYTKTDNSYFPDLREILITEPFSRMKIRLSQYEFNKELSFPFRRPNNYKIK